MSPFSPWENEVSGGAADRTKLQQPAKGELPIRKSDISKDTFCRNATERFLAPPFSSPTFIYFFLAFFISIQEMAIDGEGLLFYPSFFSPHRLRYWMDHFN